VKSISKGQADRLIQGAAREDDFLGVAVVGESVVHIEILARPVGNYKGHILLRPVGLDLYAAWAVDAVVVVKGLIVADLTSLAREAGEGGAAARGDAVI
jgi:hypothetical protein